MSRKTVITGYTLHSSVDLTDASWTSDQTNVSQIDFFAYMLEWSGLTGGGTVKVQGGIKSTRDQQGVVKWADLDLDPIPVSGSADTALINLTQLGFEYVRLVYTKDDASAGTLNVYVSAGTQGA